MRLERQEVPPPRPVLVVVLEQCLGPVELAQKHIGRSHVEAAVSCVVMATRGSFPPCAGMFVLRLGEEQPSARCGDFCVIG